MKFEKCVDRIKSLENLPPIELLPQADILNSYRLLSIERSALLLDMGRIDDAMQCLSDERNLEWHRTLCRLFTPDTFNGYFNSVKQTNPEMIENILNIIYLNIKSEIRLKIYQGQCMMARGEYRKALSYFDSVEKYIKSIDVTKISADFDECIAYLREISRNVEPYMKPVVEQTVTKLSSFKDEEVGMEYTAFQIENSIRRAQTNKAMGNLDKALELFRNVLRDSEKLDSYRKSVIPAVLIEMGEIYFSKGDLKSSLENADSAKEALKYAPLDFSTPWRLHTLYGKLSEKEENFAGALASYRQAIDYIERLHSLLYIGKRRERFFGERIEPYEGAIRS
ncbi:MAG: tetratricopeptide repeat protein, partial [Candidatus Xenobiia bacterium LiM19]